jgi:hypothetical protein
MSTLLRTEPETQDGDRAATVLGGRWRAMLKQVYWESFSYYLVISIPNDLGGGTMPWVREAGGRGRLWVQC